jgi:1-deoxy-D-xylulose-5-phosphate reductoisomerase
MKNVVILGSTGSIGRNGLRVAESLPGRLRVVGLAVGKDYRAALKQAEAFKVRHVAVADPEMAARCKAEAPRGVVVHAGEAGVEELSALPEADIVLCAVVGMAGLRPVMAAVRQGTDVALATKEVLVAAGGMVTRACRRHGVRLLPVDSEHSALFQCLQGQSPQHVGRLVLTASGGPFAFRTDVDFDTVGIEEVLNHPRWRMGRKVTVDSATLMNKGLEIAEAHWFFGVPVERIDVVVHPESIVHSMVEFVDGGIMAQMSVPDMRFAIQYAPTWPDRAAGALPRLDLAAIGTLHFYRPDVERFPALSLARAAAQRGGTLPAVLNAANEVAVGRFLDQEIPFSGIWRVVERVMARHDVVGEPDLDGILAADAWARSVAREERPRRTRNPERGARRADRGSARRQGRDKEKSSTQVVS